MQFSPSEVARIVVHKHGGCTAPGPAAPQAPRKNGATQKASDYSVPEFLHPATHGLVRQAPACRPLVILEMRQLRRPRNRASHGRVRYHVLEQKLTPAARVDVGRPVG